jgi:hypothetical protein
MSVPQSYALGLRVCGSLMRWSVPFLAVLPIVAFSGQSGLAKFAGYYTAPAAYCSELEGTALKPCDPPVEDWMQIKPIDETHAQIDIYSLQTNGHECGVSGIAELKGDKLVFVEKDTTLPQYLGQGFAVVLSGRTLKIHYLADPGLGIPSFCGARARLDRLEFSTEKKLPPRENLPET